jgi:hypothetical protein
MDVLTRPGTHQRGQWTKLRPEHSQRCQRLLVCPSAKDLSLVQMDLRVNSISRAFHSRRPGPANLYTRDMSELLPAHQSLTSPSKSTRLHIRILSSLSKTLCQPLGLSPGLPLPFHTFIIIKVVLGSFSKHLIRKPLDSLNRS